MTKKKYCVNVLDDVPKLLIVETCIETLAILKTALHTISVEIHTAASGNEALSSMLRHHYGVVVCAVSMPEMDGFELTRLMREHPETACIPVILLARQAPHKAELQAAYQQGVIECFQKPFDLTSLGYKINFLLRYHLNLMQSMRQCAELESLLREKNQYIKRMRIENEQLGYLAYHDPLTMLGNRAGFEEQLVRRLDNAKRYQRKFALLIIDIDHFKLINDAYGHDHGDKLLQEISKRIRLGLRKTDYVARLGGDEFGIILEEIKVYLDAGTIAKKLLEKISKDIMILNKEIRMSVSIGIACYPGDVVGETITSPEILMRNADIAMFRAKKRRNNAYEFYTNEFSLQHRNRLLIENSLKFAAERDEFFLVYQPKIDMKTQSLIGVEALLRWRHPEKGLIFPVQFIQILEET